MLSVIILTKNEEERIKVCLESVKWVDEIIILDNGSTDSTLDIAKQYTNKIYKFRDLDFATWRNKGKDIATQDWLLYIDPDERVLLPLREEIVEIIQSNRFSAYALSRKNVILGRLVSYNAFYPDWVIRLLKKSELKRWVGKIHEFPQFNGELGYSKNSLLHLTHRDLDRIVLKSLEWSKIEAKLRLDANHPKMSGWRFIRILFSETFHQGITRRGFFGGTVGIIDSILQTFSMFMTYVRLWQFQQPESLIAVYKDIDKNLLKNNFTYP